MVLSVPFFPSFFPSFLLPSSLPPCHHGDEGADPGSDGEHSVRPLRPQGQLHHGRVRAQEQRPAQGTRPSIIFKSNGHKLKSPSGLICLFKGPHTKTLSTVRLSEPFSESHGNTSAHAANGNEVRQVYLNNGCRLYRLPPNECHL